MFLASFFGSYELITGACIWNGLGNKYMINVHPRILFQGAAC